MSISVANTRLQTLGFLLCMVCYEALVRALNDGFLLGYLIALTSMGVEELIRMSHHR